MEKVHKNTPGFTKKDNFHFKKTAGKCKDQIPPNKFAWIQLHRPDFTNIRLILLKRHAFTKIRPNSLKRYDVYQNTSDFTKKAWFFIKIRLISAKGHISPKYAWVHLNTPEFTSHPIHSRRLNFTKFPDNTLIQWKHHNFAENSVKQYNFTENNIMLLKKQSDVTTKGLISLKTHPYSCHNKYLNLKIYTNTKKGWRKIQFKSLISLKIH